MEAGNILINGQAVFCNLDQLYQVESPVDITIKNVSDLNDDDIDFLMEVIKGFKQVEIPVMFSHSKSILQRRDEIEPRKRVIALPSRNLLG